MPPWTLCCLVSLLTQAIVFVSCAQFHVTGSQGMVCLHLQLRTIPGPPVCDQAGWQRAQPRAGLSSKGQEWLHIPVGCSVPRRHRVVLLRPGWRWSHESRWAYDACWSKGGWPAGGCCGLGGGGCICTTCINNGNSSGSRQQRQPLPFPLVVYMVTVATTSACCLVGMVQHSRQQECNRARPHAR